MRSWTDNVRKVVPYVPGEQPQGTGIIQLNTNENPYPPAPSVYAIHEKMDIDRFSLYPDPEAGNWCTAWSIIIICRKARCLWESARMMCWHWRF